MVTRKKNKTPIRKIFTRKENKLMEMMALMRMVTQLPYRQTHKKEK
jgi:hypothetical protein